MIVQWRDELESILYVWHSPISSILESGPKKIGTLIS